MNATPSFSLNENGSIPASARTFPRHRPCNVSQGAIGLLSTPGIEMDSIRLDRYYSSASYMDEPGETRVYVIPKNNATLNVSQKWKDTMREFVENTMPYLEQYHQRSNSESGFAADKRETKETWKERANL